MGDIINNNVSIETSIDTSAIAECIQKTERLCDLVKEANSLLDELASKKIKLEINI